MSTLKEVIRKVNNGLLKANVQNNVITFVTTSSVFSESTLIANLAIMYGQAGERTLIIDTDFSQDMFSEAFKVRPEISLYDYLDKNNVNIKDAVTNVKGQNVAFIQAGMLNQANTRFILNDPKFNNAIELLSHEYKHILINTAIYKDFDTLEGPLRISDGVMLVVDLASTSKHETYNMIAALKRQKANILGYITTKRA